MLGVIDEFKAEVVKLRDGDEESKQPTKDISEVVVNVPSSITDQCNKAPSCLRDQKLSEDRKMEAFAHKKSVSDGIRQRNREKKIQRESTVPSNLLLVTEISLRNDEIESSTKTVSLGNDQQKTTRLELKLFC
ncbi:20274_t:CDS:1 [Rhizophagus irregularis]|nr:20274_t:CDS:1 [Rhizophagus irregularis]